MASASTPWLRLSATESCFPFEKFARSSLYATPTATRSGPPSRSPSLYPLIPPWFQPTCATRVGPKSVGKFCGLDVVHTILPVIGSCVHVVVVLTTGRSDPPLKPLKTPAIHSSPSG